MNYKKSLLSLVTIMALSGTAYADGGATYVRLTSDAKDSAWTLFGVNGFSDGTASSRATASAGFSSSYTTLEEADTQDADASSGLSATGATQPASDNLLSVQAIDDTTLTELTVAAEVLQPYEAKEPVRSMYIKILSNTPNVKIDYKASMEGQPLELQINGQTTLYAVTISQDNTYSNPALAVESSPVSSASGNTKLSAITDVLDYNFYNNPIDAKYYSKTDHLNTHKRVNDDNTDADSATFYHFDSVSQQWKVWDKKFSGSANDFTSFSQGDAYWGQINTTDVDSGTNRTDKTINTADAADDNVTESGLVLGTSGDSTPKSSVYKDKLAVGWNMVAMDPSRPYIRHAGTGLVLGVNLTAGDINITDSTGQYVIELTLAVQNMSERAAYINSAIESEKLLGTIPSSVNIKAFASYSDTKLIIISDAKFTVNDDSDNLITDVKTLTGDNPYNETGTRTAITNLSNGGAAESKSATSAYGEHALIIDLLTHDLANDGTTGSSEVRVAADLDFVAKDECSGSGGTKHSAMIRFGTSVKDFTPIALVDESDTTTIDDLPTKTSAITSIEKHALFTADETPAAAYGQAYAIDTDGNKVDDKMIVASKVSFYVKDNTFTRVFNDENATNNKVAGVTATTDRSFEVVGSQTATITPIAQADENETTVLINQQADVNDGDTGVYADWNSSKLIAVSTTLSTFDIKDLADGDSEFFTATTDSSKLAKGAVAGVYSIGSVAQLPVVQHKVVYSNIQIPFDTTADAYKDQTGVNAGTTNSDYNITISINGDAAREANITDINQTTYPLTTTGIKAFYDNLVAKINLLFRADNHADDGSDDQDKNITHGFAYHTYNTSDGVTEAVFEAVQVGIVGMDLDGNTTQIFADYNTSTLDTTHFLPDVDSNNTADDTNTAPTINSLTPDVAGSLGSSWTPLVGDLKTNAIYTPDFAEYGPLYTFFDAGYSVRSILKATTDFSDQSIAWDGIDLTRDEDDWFANNEFNLFNVNLHSGYWVYLESASTTSITIGAASYTPTYTYYFDNAVKGEYSTKNIINGGQFTVEIKGFNGGITNAFVTVAGEEVQLKRNGISDNYTADFMKYSLTSFSEGSSGPLSFSIRATDGKGEYAVAPVVGDENNTVVVDFDYTAPVAAAATAPTNSTVKFNVASPTTTDAVTYHVFKSYIPELESSRASTDTTISRLIGSYPVVGGAVNICSALTFGEVTNIRYVAADGTGVIGTSNLSDAMQFTYGTMLKGSVVLTHVNGSGDKAILGLTYASDCTTDGVVPTDVTKNKGVSLKSLESAQTSRLAYEPVAGVGSSLSEAWLSTYSIDGVDRIQVQNLEEYAGKPFFVEYNGKMYRSAFPSTLADAEASATNSIALDDSVAFSLTSLGVRDTSGDSTTPRTTGTGELITILNSSLSQ